MSRLECIECCGIRELWIGMGKSHDPKTVLLSLLTDYNFHVSNAPRNYSNREDYGKLLPDPTLAYCVPIILVTDNQESRCKNGTRLVQFIEENKLGDIVASGVRKNPNSGNRIQAWLWTIDKKAFVSWAKENQENPKTPRRRSRGLRG